MKIALCISGLLRTFEKNFPNLNEFLLNKYHTDIFVHTWSEIDRGIVVSDFENKVCKTYNPKRYLIENPIDFLESEKMLDLNNANYNVNGVLSMFYSIKKSIELIGDDDYDLVIRFRGDCLLKSDWELLSPSSGITIPVYGNFAGYNDQIAYGNKENMKHYSMCFDKIPSYCEDNVEFCPEILLKHHLGSTTINRQDVDYDIVWYNGHVHNMKQKEIDYK